jgi:ABC-type lipoprotein export system ATPase subunit
MTASPPVDAIETAGLARYYGKGGAHQVCALQDVTISVPAGRFVVLKGRSGSGKTTLLNCLGGLDRPSAGVVKIFGRDLSTFNDRQLSIWRRTEIGFVFQSFGLLPTLSAYENVELSLRLANAGIRERYARTRYCLRAVGLEKWADHRPSELSGGQQQRVAIARAIANIPRLVFADEPTGELDSTTGAQILALFREIVDREQVTLLVTSHDARVDEYADTVLQLYDGRIVDAATNQPHN